MGGEGKAIGGGMGASLAVLSIFGEEKKTVAPYCFFGRVK